MCNKFNDTCDFHMWLMMEVLVALSVSVLVRVHMLCRERTHRGHGHETQGDTVDGIGCIFWVLGTDEPLPWKMNQLMHPVQIFLFHRHPLREYLLPFFLSLQVKGNLSSSSPVTCNLHKLLPWQFMSKVGNIFTCPPPVNVFVCVCVCVCPRSLPFCL